MNKKGTSLFENGLIWFGAGVSLAEILTGTYFAPLGFQKGIWAIIIGHIIGCLMLFFAGLIGGKLWLKGWFTFLSTKCSSTCWLDSYYDL